MLAFAAQNNNGFASSYKCTANALGDVFEKANAADCRCWQNAFAVGFVVEGDVTGNDWGFQGLTSFANAFQAANKLAHDLGLFRIAEVQVVGDCQWQGANCGQVAVVSATACLPPSYGFA